VPLSKLLEALETDAEREAAQVIREAEERAQQILEEASRAAKQAEETTRREAVASLPAAQARIDYDAQLKIQGMFADVREQLIARVMDVVVRELADLPNTPRYGEVMRALLGEAAHLIDTDLVVHVRAEDKKLAEKLVKALGRKAAVETTLKGWGGLVVLSADGLVRVDNTLEARLESATPAIRQHVARQLMAVTGVENA
jgi:V/A-type H+-transporting ATPase subunit E